MFICQGKVDHEKKFFCVMSKVKRLANIERGIELKEANRRSCKDDSNTFSLPGELCSIPHAQLPTDRLPRPLVKSLHETADALFDRLEGLLKTNEPGTGITHISLDEATHSLIFLRHKDHSSTADTYPGSATKLTKSSFSK